MEKLILLTDGSVDTKSKIGYGAYLALSDPGLSLDLLKTRVKVKRFENTSSTKLELQALLWALSNINISGRKLFVYTDSQNILGLMKRRNRLEQNNYRSKKNRHINNYKLYQKFFRITDQLACEFVKVRGHRVLSQKDNIDRLFTLVDRASRHALREDKRSWK
ncbi:MAG: ribonuclease H [Desulfobacterales bacterium]|nr:ribonuclease H [Desulfobacterales bacterium]